MAQAKEGDTVKIIFTVALEDGTVFDSNVNGEPLEVKIGGGQVIPGLEEAVVGMSPGESKKIKITADKAFGQRDEGRVTVIAREEFPADMKLEVGKELQITKGSKQVSLHTIVDVSESSVTLDANHPLAGKDIVLEVKVVDIV